MLKHISTLAIIAGIALAPAMAQDARQINVVKAGKSCAGCNLFQAELNYQDAANLNLSKSRLRQASLALVTFDAVNFSGANLSVANMFGARFNRCDFRKADLSQVAAVGTFFGSSKFHGAKLTGTNLSGADLSLATGLTQKQLDQTCGDRSTRLPKGLRIPACR